MNAISGRDQITVVIWSGAGRLTLLRDALYAAAALARSSARVVVATGADDRAHVEAVTQLLARLDGLLDVSLLAEPGPSPNPGFPFERALTGISTEFCTLQRDDHVMYPRHAAVLIDALRREPSAAMAYGGGFRCWGRLTAEAFLSERKQRWRADPFDRARIFRENFISLSASVVRTEHARTAGIGYRGNLGDLEEWLFLRRLAVQHPFVAVDQPVGEHRVMGDEPESWPVDRRHPGDPVYDAVVRRSDEHVAITASDLARVYETHAAALAHERRRAQDLAHLVASAEERATQLEAEVIRANERLDALARSPVIRLYRRFRRTGLHVPLRSLHKRLRRTRR